MDRIGKFALECNNGAALRMRHSSASGFGFNSGERIAGGERDPPCSMHVGVLSSLSASTPRRRAREGERVPPIIENPSVGNQDLLSKLRCLTVKVRQSLERVKAREMVQQSFPRTRESRTRPRARIWTAAYAWVTDGFCRRSLRVWTLTPRETKHRSHCKVVPKRFCSGPRF